MTSTSASGLRTSRKSASFLLSVALWTFCLFGFPLFAAPQSDRVGQLSVRVRDRRTENQLEQVRVELIRFPDGTIGEQFTGSDGAVRFTGIGVGAYTVRATRQGYEAGEARVDFRKGDSTAQNVDIPLTALDPPGPATLGGNVSKQGLLIPVK